MKRFTAIACLLVTSVMPINSAEPPPSQEAILLAVKEIQAQQAAMAANQTQIEEKLAAVTEAIRVARIYSSRSGK